MVSEGALLTDPFDPETWGVLLDDPEVSSATLEKALQLFPTSPKVWALYAKHDLGLGDVDSANRLYVRGISVCPHVHLWSAYLRFAMEHRTGELLELYEAAVAAVGESCESGHIWRTYLALLVQAYESKYESLPAPLSLMDGLPPLPTIKVPADAVPTLERICKAWDDALAAPVGLDSARVLRVSRTAFDEAVGIPKRDYEDKWEVRNALHELYSQVDTLALAVPLTRENAPAQEQSAARWRALLEYEKKNPFGREKEAFHARVVWVLQQALMCHRYLSAFWYAMVVWVKGDAKDLPPEALQVLERAVSTLPHDGLLRVFHALALETSSAAEAVKAFQKLLDDFADRDVPCPVGLMQYLALLRRTATKEEFRRTWNEAKHRWTFHTTWEVYSMVAWMDWRSFGERDVATAIFAEGIARFDHARLVLSYVDLLLEARGLLQARAALAAAVQRVGGTDADLIWQRWYDLEVLYGDASGAAVDEARARGEARPFAGASLRELQQRLETAGQGLALATAWPGGADAAGGREFPDQPRGRSVRGWIRRPDTTRMQRYRPVLDFKAADRSVLSPAVKSLLGLLPDRPLKAILSSDAEPVLQQLLTQNIPAIDIKVLEEHQARVRDDDLDVDERDVKRARTDGAPLAIAM